MDRTDALKLFHAILDASMEDRRERGGVPLSFFLAMPNHELVHVPAVPGFDAGDMAETVRGISEQFGARYVVTVGEAWVSVRETVEGVRPSQDPERTEALMVSIDGPDLERVASVEIRPDGTLGEPVIRDAFGGRMANLSGMTGIN